MRQERDELVEQAITRMRDAAHPLDVIRANPTTYPIPQDREVLLMLIGGLAYTTTQGNMEATIEFCSRLPKEEGIFAMALTLKVFPEATTSKTLIKWCSAHRDWFGFT